MISKDDTSAGVRRASLAGLVAAITDIFRACSVPPEVARTVAEHLVDADACGVTSHGIIRVPQYVQAIDEKRVIPDARLTVRHSTPSTAVFDGGNGFGQVMAGGAMNVACERAKETGVAAVTLVNCGHTGRLGSYTERAARRGMAAMMMVNTGGHGQWVAPFGGIAGRLATNPLSIAVPAGTADPLVLDIATSAAPEGKIRALLAAAKAIPAGWVVDHGGKPTTNPADLYGPPRGALLPFGGHKGFGLSMLIDALAGGLSGAGCCTTTETPLAGKTDGVFILAINVEAFVAPAAFCEEVARLVDHVKSCPTACGVSEILVPGELEARTRRDRLLHGLPIDDGTWNLVKETAERLTVPMPAR